eukprot:CAMPEP_0181167960 /NCGR_PEP_ID=MMETSP1096-20121128/3_1 /TAXON_ID=156174 ORGANISM="Chrysochromulina ericina, Strain CCMP281" /NCGR_SAMPLE_ID=MMETSP1096 /ASSEMBLY_ACC=CAM_ASM_000453 /LENGTH=110 /DNA_ID=CAMNT_0023255273 /DNA_START=8 /DNA_END=340 /DNA_ORIENTATION=-
MAAKDFAPQQVRRMAGLLIAVVSGRLGLDYIHKCFGPELVPTPLAPAEAMWLDRLQLSPKAQAWASTGSGARDPAQEAAIRVDIAREIREVARVPLAAFAAELSSWPIQA